ncbi:hypothetical protein RCZ04_02650 [Capnocytophaga sp. HP1101]
MKKLLYLCTIALALFACKKNDPDDLFGKTPTQRFQEQEAELRSELSSPQQGWKLVYHTTKDFGKFVFLMKFTPEGFVTMASDARLPGTPETSKYEIKWGQGTLLSFTTKNYLHELSDAMQGIPGVGYAGDFEFIYFGKEGNKLKFRTQRKKTEQFVYFEPASAEDWADIETLSKNVNTLEENIDKYYFKVENNGVTTYYNMEYNSRNIVLAPLANPDAILRATVSSSKAGITFSPTITLEGKTFTELICDNSTTPPTYKATVDGVTAEIFYSQTIPDEFISDDYKDIGTKYKELLFFGDPLAEYSSETFIQNVLKINDTKSFSRVYFVFDKNTGKCDVTLLYLFPNKSNLSRIVYTYDYEFKNKRLYLSNPQFTTNGTTDIALWRASENADVFAKVTSAINNILSASTEGFYIEKYPRTIKYTNTIYSLSSRSIPTFSFLAYASN